MQLTQIFSLALLGATTASAQGLNITAIYEKKPALVSATPLPIKTFDRHAAAAKIINSLKSSHSSVLKAQATGKPVKQDKPGKLTTKLTTTTTTLIKKPAAPSSKATPAKKPSPAGTQAAAGTATGKPKSFRFKREPIPAAASSSSSNTCSALTYLFGYSPTVNTAMGFSNDGTLISRSTAGLAPAGYTKAFTGQLGSIFSDSNYLTYYEMDSYNATQCAAYCDAWSGCAAFNLYFERLPSLLPGTSCMDPAAAVAVKCALWKFKPTVSDAKNQGEFRSDFMVLITGSNLYTKNTAPSSIGGYQGPTALAGVVDVYNAGIQSMLVGSTFFQGTYNPQQCLTWCSLVATLTKPCNFIDAAIISVRGTGGGLLGTYCVAYTSSTVAQYANVYNATINGVVYDVTNSYAYSVAGK